MRSTATRVGNSMKCCRRPLVNRAFHLELRCANGPFWPKIAYRHMGEADRSWLWLTARAPQWYGQPRQEKPLFSQRRSKHVLAEVYRSHRCRGLRPDDRSENR